MKQTQHIHNIELIDEVENLKNKSKGKINPRHPNLGNHHYKKYRLQTQETFTTLIIWTL